MSALVTEHLTLLAGAPNGIRKLRELILELAVRGKLVPQDARDEPAIELLKRIEISDRKLGDQRDEFDGAFQLPASWEWVRLGEIARHNAGKTLDKGRNSGDLRDYITTSNLYWGRFELGSVRQMRIEESELERCTARKGDLLVCEGGEAGRAAVWESDKTVCFQNHVHRVRFFGDLVSHYFYRCFERLNATGEINQYRKGVAISSMSGKTLSSIPFPLPPLAEQHRIVAKINELMALCDRLATGQADAESAHTQLVEALLGSLTQARDASDFAASWQRLSQHFHTLFTNESSIDALKQTLLQLAVMGKLVPQDVNDQTAIELLNEIAEEKWRMIEEEEIKRPRQQADLREFVEPVEDLPFGWAWGTLSRIGLTATGGTPPTGNPEYYFGDLPFVGPGQIDNTGKISNSGKWLSESARGETTIAEPNDILMVCIGGSIGKSAVADRSMAFNQQINSVKPLLSDHRYVALAVSAPNFQRLVLDNASGSATPIINRTKWEGLPVPIPPRNEQHRIVAKVDQLMALCDQLKSCLTQARQLNEQLASTLVEQAVA